LTDLSNYKELCVELEGWVDDRTGIINYVTLNVPDDDEIDLPVTSTSRLSIYTEGKYQKATEPFLSSGKGLTPIEAMIGAVGEALERYSAARYREDMLVRAALNDLQGDCLDPRKLGLYTEEQYELPEFPFARFEPDQPIHWKQGHWLDTGDPVWLPALLTFFNFHPPPSELFSQVSSNGLAAGEHIVDAALRATLELVERDALMITWHCRLASTRVIPDDSLDPGSLEVLRQIGRHGTQVELYLLNVGIAIPVVACLAMGDGKHWPGVTVALGAHPSIRTAMRKAILEQGAVGPYIRRMMLSDEPIPQTPDEVRSLNDHALYYVPVERRSIFNFLRSDTVLPIKLSDTEESGEVSMSWVTRRLTDAGVRVAIADVTSPDLEGSGFRVARALGVDVQPIDFGFSLRRLTNLRLKKLLVGEPNPYPHPLA
jgi:ribosomal protein S12 methylthiotransferase accessory factor